MQSHPDRKKFLHIGFELSLFIKGLDGVLEIIGGAVFLFVNPSRMNSLVFFLTSREITEDPHDLIANILINMSFG